MSKWINADRAALFAKSLQDKAADRTTTEGSFARKWKNPEAGSETKSKEYRLRFLPDSNGDFYRSYFYHFIKSGERGKYILCNKTHGMDQFCPWCSAVASLYKGNATDKTKAGELRRKEKFVGNVFIVDDPRDAEMKEDAYKVMGTVRLYEFPGTVESKIRDEITDTDEGHGVSIFDPEHGYDCILKVKAKPKDKNGKPWPDYSDTKFSNKPTAIAGSDKEIEKLMGDTQSIAEYIEKMGLSWEEQEKLLKENMLWEDVEFEFRKVLGKKEDAVKSALEEMDQVPFELEEHAKASEKLMKDDPEEDNPGSSEDDDEEDLLAEIAAMRKKK